MNAPAKILIVDDEKSIRITMREFLTDIGYEVHIAKNAQDALSHIDDNDYDVIVSDIMMPQISGITLLEIIRSKESKPQVILITGQPSLNTAIEAVRKGANDYISKPISKDTIQKVVKNAVNLKQLEDDKRILQTELLRHREHLEELVEERTQSLVESEERYRGIFDSAINMIHTIDTDSIIIDSNQAELETLGYTKEELIGQSLLKIVHPDFKSFTQEQLKKTLDGEIVNSYETCLVDKKGTPIHVRTAAVPFKKNGKVISVHGTSVNLTKRIKAEAALAEERSLLLNLIDNIPDAIYFKDKLGRFIRINPALAKQFGLESSTHAVGKSDFDFFTEEQAYERKSDEQRIIETEIPIIDKEENSSLSDGSDHWISTTKMPLRNQEGKVIGTFGMSRDITERKTLELNLARALDKALVASKIKNQFLSTISHELLTPMNGVIGFSEILMQSNLSEQQKDACNNLKTSAEDLLVLIEDMLDFSKLDAKSVKLENISFSIPNLVSESIERRYNRALDKGLSLTYTIDPILNKTVSGDPQRIRQVLDNLLKNAIKFTESGKIEIHVSADKRYSHSTVSFRVIDTGIGIPDELHSRLFDAFTQADSSNTRQYGGTGLGLAISQQLVELMGGKIGVESREGKGSTFWFDLNLFS